MRRKRKAVSGKFQNRRLVVLAGPHKAASSSVQDLFTRRASNLERFRHHPSLVNWTWPYIKRRHLYSSQKAFAPLVKEDEEFQNDVYRTILKVWRGKDSHLVLGSEELDRFGETPWSHWDGIKVIRNLHNMTQPDRMQIVVNHRRPRSAHWISVWKQLVRRKKTSYKDFLCKPKGYQMVWEYLDCVANPLGFVEELLKNGWEVHLLDMQGIAAMGRDVGHVTACEVLGVPCQDHRLPDMKLDIQKNMKSRDPVLEESQLMDMEWALRQRDCTYQTVLEDYRSKGQLTIHYGASLWDKCDNPNSSLANTTLLLDFLRGQVGCGGKYQNVTLLQEQALESRKGEVQELFEGAPYFTMNYDKALQAQKSLLLVVFVIWALLMRTKLRRLAGGRRNKAIPGGPVNAEA